MKKLKTLAAGWLLLHLIWLAASMLMRSRVLPGPAAVYAGFNRGFLFRLAAHTGASLYRIFLGLFFSVAAGFPLGLFIGTSSRFRRVLDPLVYLSYPIPKTAFLPVVMLLLGLGNSSKVLLLALTAVFPVLVAVRDAVLRIDPSCCRAAKSAGASPCSLLFHITIPAVLPELFTSLRIGAGTSLSVLILVEAYGTRRGLGYFILDAWSRMDYTGMYGGILVLSFSGALLFCLLDLLSGRLCRWKP